MATGTPCAETGAVSPPTVLAPPRSSRIATWLILPGVGVLIGWAAVALRDEWLAQEWLPWHQPAELLDWLAGRLGGWAPVVFIGVGLAAGALLALAAMDEEVTLAVADDQVTITRGSSVRRYLAKDIREALRDGKHLVLVADNGLDLVRIKTPEISGESLAAAFKAHGYLWSG